jgi:alkylation response protein AidB-like acyl-CoA dehydrogenase
MDLSLSDDQELLQSTVRSFVEHEARTEVLTGMQTSRTGLRPEWLHPMAEAGWLGAVLPLDVGGSDASTLDAAIIFEELGRGPVPGPFLVSNVVAALMLRCAESSALRDDVLGGLATGEAVVSPILPGLSSLIEGEQSLLSVSETKSGGFSLQGTVPFVPYASAATHLLLPRTATTASGRCDLALIPTSALGVSVRRLEGLLAWNFEVYLSDARVEPDQVLTGVEQVHLERALHRAFAIVSAYQMGGCQALLERSVAYSNTRIQFSVPIGSFQRVQDHVVELLNALDAARWITYDAIWRLDTDQEAVAAAHLAKAVASESYLTCTDFAHKVHGGIGVDPQYGLTLYTQMARSLYGFLGHPRWHKRQMLDALQANFVSEVSR